MAETKDTASTPAEVAVYAAAEGGRATQEIVEVTGLPEPVIIGCLQSLVSAGRLVGVPRSAPWYVFWAWS